MAVCPDFSDSDSNLSDDPDYKDFKHRARQLRMEQQKLSVTNRETGDKDQQLKSLFMALSSGNLKAVTEHLDNGLDVNCSVEEGWTPLLLAACFGNPELTQELIKRGANVNADRDGCTALMMACNCPKNTTPHSKSLEVIKQLVEKDANVTAINRKRMTALMFAANVGNLGAVKYLLPLSDKNAEDNQKWTALFWAVNNNEFEVVKYLLEEGLEYTKSDVRNNTPVDIAKNNDFNEIVELFPKEEDDIISTIVDSRFLTFEQNFSELKRGEKPKFFLDICNILCGVKNESVIKLMADKDIDLYKFLSISEEELKDLGINLPFQRHRILGGLYRFHKQPYHPKSLHQVPLPSEPYSNADMAVQLLSAIKQVIVMEASLAYILKNNTDSSIYKSDLVKKNISNIRNKVKLCKKITNKLCVKAKQLDSQIKPVDYITANSRRYLWPWRKIVFSFSVLSLAIVIKYWK